jgi:hypothetical protein
MLLVQEFMITGSVSQIKNTYPPEPWAEFEKEISVQKEGGKDIWDTLQKTNTKVTKEKDLYTLFSQLLQKAGYKFWQDNNNDHRKAVSVPDFVIYCGDKWDPSRNADRVNVLIDIEIKQWFNTINLMAATTKKYPEDTGTAYVQALKRAAQAFKVDSRISYFVVVMDMESIIFWKIEPTTSKSVQAYGVCSPFGGKYAQHNGMVTLASNSPISEELTLTFPGVDKMPKGFQHFFSLIEWRMKASAEVITIVCLFKPI